MREICAVFFIIAVNTVMLFYGVSTLSISYYEADIFYNQEGALHYLINLSCAVFGQNDYALRAPFIVIHIFSTTLLYLVSKPLLKRGTDRLITILIYVMLPGSIVVSLAANGAAFMILVTLLFLYLRQKNSNLAMYALLILSLFLGKGFILLYFLLFFYAVNKQNVVLMMLSLTLFAVGMYVYDFDIGGRPRGYFMDTFSVYAAIFSPLLFLYFIYTLYRILVKESKTLLWWLSFGAFIVSLLLSFRQRVAIEEFASYTIIAAPLIVGTFMNSFRVRLPQYRKLHKFFAFLVVLSLVLNYAAVFANHHLYTFLDKPKKHFAYKYHIAKDLAKILHERGIYEVQIDDKTLSMRLKFYGIEQGGTAILRQSLLGDIIIKYAGKNIISFEVIDLM